jgi:mannan endo-1,4-beta-mannosidase
LKGIRVLALLALLACSGCMTPAPRTASRERESPGFVLDGQPFCFAGANSYYPIYKPRAMVDDLFDAARALDLKVMRIWGMLDRGSLDGHVPNADGVGHKEGVYFQYWDTAHARPAYNDGPDGLQRLDYVLAAAAARDLKLIVVLTNNWRPFGGIDQYLLWYGRSKHHEFYTLPETKQAYRAWLAHVITRVNSLTGRSYRDDPTIFAWELANEPRCKNGSSFDASQGWDTSTLTTWAAEMSSYVKSLDPNHLVSVGDEGFLNQGGQHWTRRAEAGVDHAALTALPNVDFGTFHLYPEDWQVPDSFGERWITEHLAIADRLGKPSVLEEYGTKLTRGFGQRRDDYRRWHQALLSGGGSASLAWMLAGPGYPDYDHFTFHRDDATAKLLSEFVPQVDRRCRSRPAPNVPASSFVATARAGQRVASEWLQHGDASPAGVAPDAVE